MEYMKKISSLFGLDIEEEELKLLQKRLKQYERRFSKLNELACNGEIDREEYEAQTNTLENKIRCLLKDDGKLFFNGDPRGYAIKVKPEFSQGLIRDWGGYGIIVPDNL